MFGIFDLYLKPYARIFNFNTGQWAALEWKEINISGRNIILTAIMNDKLFKGGKCDPRGDVTSPIIH